MGGIFASLNGSMGLGRKAWVKGLEVRRNREEKAPGLGGEPACLLHIKEKKKTTHSPKGERQRKRPNDEALEKIESENGEASDPSPQDQAATSKKLSERSWY